MKKSKSVKEKLIRGDYQTIAGLTGFSKVYVRQVLNGIGGRRNEIIFKAAKDLIKERSTLIRSLQTELNRFKTLSN